MLQPSHPGPRLLRPRSQKAQAPTFFPKWAPCQRGRRPLSSVARRELPPTHGAGPGPQQSPGPEEGHHSHSQARAQPHEEEDEHSSNQIMLLLTLSMGLLTLPWIRLYPATVLLGLPLLVVPATGNALWPLIQEGFDMLSATGRFFRETQTPPEDIAAAVAAHAHVAQAAAAHAVHAHAGGLAPNGGPAGPGPMPPYCSHHAPGGQLHTVVAPAAVHATAARPAQAARSYLNGRDSTAPMQPRHHPQKQQQQWPPGAQQQAPYWQQQQQQHLASYPPQQHRPGPGVGMDHGAQPSSGHYGPVPGQHSQQQQQHVHHHHDLHGSAHAHGHHHHHLTARVMSNGEASPSSSQPGQQQPGADAAWLGTSSLSEHDTVHQARVPAAQHSSIPPAAAQHGAGRPAPAGQHAGAHAHVEPAESHPKRP